MTTDVTRRFVALQIEAFVCDHRTDPTVLERMEAELPRDDWRAAWDLARTRLEGEFVAVFRRWKEGRDHGQAPQFPDGGTNPLVALPQPRYRASGD